MLVFARMPKITTSSHPLARLRAICGWTREDAARVAGISAASIQNIELGRAPIPEDAALRVEAATACKASSLMDKHGAPLLIDGRPYERKTYNSYLDASTAKPEKIDAAAADLEFRLKMLLASSGNRFLYVARRLGGAFDAILQEANISLDYLESIERKAASISVAEMTVAELRSKLADEPVLREWIKANPQPDKSKCKVVDESYQHWPTSDFGNGIIYAKFNQRHRYRIEFAAGQRLEVIVDKWKAKGVSGKATQHPAPGTGMALVPSPAFRKKRKNRSKPPED